VKAQNLEPEMDEKQEEKQDLKEKHDLKAKAQPELERKFEEISNLLKSTQVTIMIDIIIILVFICLFNIFLHL